MSEEVMDGKNKEKTSKNEWKVPMKTCKNMYRKKTQPIHIMHFTDPEAMEKQDDEVDEIQPVVEPKQSMTTTRQRQKKETRNQRRQRRLLETKRDEQEQNDVQQCLEHMQQELVDDVRGR